MKEYIPEIMRKGEHGLYLCELPTGNGKTYNVIQAMRDYALDPDCHRKMIFMTTLIKNLPEADLLAAFGGNERLYHQHVLRIRSNFDEVIEQIGELEIPETFQTPAYSALLAAVQQYNQAIRNQAQDAAYLAELHRRVDEAERSFRHEITRWLKNHYGSKRDRLNAIRSEDALRWIGVLYPAVYTDDHQILLLTVSKFMTRNAVLVEPSYAFLTSDVVRDAIIYIDEIDATKATIQNGLIADALSSKEDYLTLFRQILRGPGADQLSGALTRAYQRLEGAVPAQYTYQGIYEEARQIAEKYAAGLSYKTVEDVAATRQNYLFRDTTYHTVAHDDWDYIRACRNHEENRVDLYLEKRKAYYENQAASGEDDIAIYGLLRDINRFLDHYKYFLLLWANNYCDEVNAVRKANAVNGSRDQMTLDNAIYTIVSRMGLGLTVGKSFCEV